MNIADVAGGAIIEQLDSEINRVLDNIMDPNTEPLKKRKVILTLVFSPSNERDISDINFITKSQLAPSKPINTRIAFDKDKFGQIVAEELTKNQMKGQTTIGVHTGEILESKINSKILNIK